MPFSIEMVSAQDRTTGHFIIDRKSFIFAYPERDKDCYLHRQLLIDVIRDYHIGSMLPLSTTKGFAETEDPRHDALEHLSEYDRHHCIHYHIIFEYDIDKDMLIYFFNALINVSIFDSSLGRMISKENCQFILDQSLNYLNELTVDSTAKMIESEYRKMKEAESEKAEQLVQKQKMMQEINQPLLTIFNEESKGEKELKKNEYTSFPYLTDGEDEYLSSALALLLTAKLLSSQLNKQIHKKVDPVPLSSMLIKLINDKEVTKSPSIFVSPAKSNSFFMRPDKERMLLLAPTNKEDKQEIFTQESSGCYIM